MDTNNIPIDIFLDHSKAFGTLLFIIHVYITDFSELTEKFDFIIYADIQLYRVP